MFSSPEKRIKKESAAAKSKKNSSEQSSPDKYKSIASKKLNALQEKSDAHSSNSDLSNLQEKANKNNTGLPDPLKQGMESLSGISLDDVKVNYNSNKPSDLGAHAYAEGNQIHVGGGQEKHLAHEAWHVVQQKQGRVNSTKEINGTSINDDSALESEATKMGAKALNNSTTVNQNKLISSSSANTNVAQLAEDGQQEEEKKGFFGRAWDAAKSGANTAWDATKSGANTAWDATKSGANSAKEWAKNNKGDAAAKGAQAITGATSFGLKTAGDAAGAGISSGVGGLIGGTYGMAKGAYDFNESRKNKNDLQKSLDEAKTDEEKINIRTKIQLEKDRMGRAGAGTVASTLSTIGAGFTASGVGAPVGVALGAASAGVSAATSAAGAGVQHLRDREARRLRSDDEIISDRTEKNKARIEKEKGSKFNPLNWKAKIDKRLGWNQTGKNAVGTDLDTDGSAAEEYKASKNSKYEDEGWSRTKNDKGDVISSNKGASKSWRSALDPRNWGKKQMDNVDIGVSKNLSSKNVKKFSKDYDKERKKEKSWYNPF